MKTTIQENRKGNETFISIISDDIHSLVESVSQYVKKYVGLKIEKLITPTDKYYYDPITFLPIEGGNHYPQYGILLKA